MRSKSLLRIPDGGIAAWISAGVGKPWDAEDTGVETRV